MLILPNTHLKLEAFQRNITPEQKIPQLGSHVGVACMQGVGIVEIDLQTLYRENVFLVDSNSPSWDERITNTVLFGVFLNTARVQPYTGCHGTSNELIYAEGHKLIDPIPPHNHTAWDDIKRVQPKRLGLPFFVNLRTGDPVLHADILWMYSEIVNHTARSITLLSGCQGKVIIDASHL